jgi:RimJ/RimL family protein N-acetyltransferase
MELKLGDLTVRTLTVRDAELLVEATRNEPGMAVWGPHPVGPYTPEDAISALRAWDDAGQTSFGVMAGDRLAGALGLMPDQPGSAELAYWVRPEDRGRRIAGHALRALADWALAEGGFERVWLEINPDNAASLKVAERAGFTFEERVANHCPPHDCLIWARRPARFR